MLSVYIHIPFCSQICTYCDFCKVLKKDEWINAYLGALKQEIESNYQGDTIKTLYIGGGTPSSLNISQLKELFAILKIFKLSPNAEITFESNIEDLTKEKLKFLKNKITRLSIGVQTFDSKLIKLLGRKVPNIETIKEAQKYFNNINVDLMYGFNEENMQTLKKDIEILLKLNIPHISTYSLILEPHTKLYIDNYKLINEDTKNEEYINKVLKENGYMHYEISNYAKKGYESKHNLVYWNNEHYYGFGLGASGYINNIRYENTKNLNKYLNNEFSRVTHKLDDNETLQNEFILGLRKIKGINKDKFHKKYNFNPLEIHAVKKLINKQELIDDGQNIYINPKYLYYSNEILINFLDDNLHKH